MEPILIVVAVVVLVPVIWWIAVYNRITNLKNTTKESWSDIDVELKRRYDLIPNLVETVKGYAKHERETLERVVELRNTAMGNHGSAASQGQDEGRLGVAEAESLREALGRRLPDGGPIDLPEQSAPREPELSAGMAEALLELNAADAVVWRRLAERGEAQVALAG